jgi:hypothetical protein
MYVFFFFFVSLFAALASCTSVTLYQGDGNALATVKAIKGLKAKGYNCLNTVVPS